MKAWKLLFASLVLALAALPARAQGPTYTIPQTVTQTLASNQACTGANQDFHVTNLGQVQHAVTMIPSAATQQFKLEIYGNNGTLPVLISDSALMAQPGSTSRTVMAFGYFADVFVRVNCTTASSFSVYYVGSSASSPLIVGDYQGAQLDKMVFAGIPATASQSQTFRSPFGTSAGVVVASFGGGGTVTGNSFAVLCEAGPFEAFTQTFNFSFTTTSTASFVIPSGPCPFVTLTYSHGTGTATSLTLNYVFTPPGTLAGPPSALLSNPINPISQIAEKGARWSQVSAPAVSTKATASQAAGASGVRHVADCVSYSAGAITAPAATQLTINLRDGATGAGTVIWSKTVTIPATAAPHYDQNFCGLNLIGTAATAMTLEFSALLTNEFESVTLTGYDVQ